MADVRLMKNSAFSCNPCFWGLEVYHVVATWYQAVGKRNTTALIWLTDLLSVVDHHYYPNIDSSVNYNLD
jgi:hypothetical protein